jgi:2,3-bisphosphoglycerate-dependent phosphoglycerate mutase
MTLYLVRHARPLAGVEHVDPGLDPVGRSQAEHLARALRHVGAKRLVSSPMRRARETAQPIAEALGMSIETVEEVAEVFDRMMNISERRRMLAPFLSGRWSQQPERLREWRDKVLTKLVELGEEPTIVVSHFVAISAAIGASTEDDRIAPCPLANASITTIEIRGGRFVLRRPGEVAHLPPDEITASHAPPPSGP